MRRGVPARAQPFTIPAPVGGLNTVSAGLSMPPTDCSEAVNLMAAEAGLRTRLGYREIAIGVTGTITNEVRSIIPFTGGTPAANRLFVATDKGIYDVTQGGATPPLVVTFATHVGNAGFGVSTVMVTAAGHYLVYCDELNGVWVYTDNGSTWTHVTQGTDTGSGQISGVDPGRFVFPFVFKGRLWFVERDSGNAWYLDTGQVFGAAHRFPVGALFRKGGSLVALYSWTYDGGAGLDDSMVGVSSGGDVLVYQGTDPSSSATFGLKGVWYVGPPPAGRRIGSSTGGELSLLSRQGLVPMSKLVLGAITPSEYATAKISNYLSDIMLVKAPFQGWDVVQQPEDGTLIILVPQGYSPDHLQLAQSLASPLRPWFVYDGLPMLSAGAWNAQLYFGTADGRVCVHTGFADAVPLSGTATSLPIKWSVVTAFSTLGTTAMKRMQLLRPLVLTSAKAPSISAEARYNFDTTLATARSIPSSSKSAWGVAVWGVAKWGGSSISYSRAQGASGVGMYAAVAVSGSALVKTTLLGIDVTFTAGRFL